jgi:hypothetical protein
VIAFIMMYNLVWYLGHSNLVRISQAHPTNYFVWYIGQVVIYDSKEKMMTCPMYRTKLLHRMGLAYEPSLSDGKYRVSGKTGSRSQIFTKDSILKKLLQEFYLLPLVFILCNYFVGYIGQVVIYDSIEKMAACFMYRTK